MNRELQVTADGSHTFQLSDSDITFHSRFGAIQESEHVYISAGLLPFIGKTDPIRVFEMGFGTGLNAFLTYMEARDEKVRVEYDAIEAFPLEKEEYSLLNYAHVLNKQGFADTLQMLHQAPWGKTIKLGQFFTLVKHHEKIENFQSSKKFDVIFYDAFAPTAQPELWTEDIFYNLYDMLEDGGILTTYCSKGDVRRTLQSVGFDIEKLPGPRGKREMVRAFKTI